MAAKSTTKPAETSEAQDTSVSSPKHAGEQTTETTNSEAGTSDEHPQEKAEEKAAPEDDGKATPLVWAKKLGKFGKDPKLSVNGKPRPAPVSWDHAVADQVHGWTEHGQHSADPLRITREAYEAALQAARTPDDHGNYSAHVAAKSQYKRGS